VQGYGDCICNLPQTVFKYRTSLVSSTATSLNRAVLVLNIILVKLIIRNINCKIVLLVSFFCIVEVRNDILHPTTTIRRIRSRAFDILRWSGFSNIFWLFQMKGIVKGLQQYFQANYNTFVSISVNIMRPYCLK